MKKIILVLIISISLFSFKTITDNNFTITGIIKDFKKGKAYLETLDKNGELKTIDSVQIKNGKFQFKGTVAEPDFYLISIATLEGKIPLILENGKIDVTVYKDSLFASTVSGTYNNEQLMEFNSVSKKLQEKLYAFQQKNENKIQTAQENNDTDFIIKLQEEYAVIETEFSNHVESYITTHPNSFITVMLLHNAVNQPSAKISQIKENYNTLSPSLKNTKPGKEILEKLNTLGIVEIGVIAPNFSAPDPEGKIVSLKETLGKVTIIHFWASWCSSCEEENPNMVAIYNDYHNKGLNIIGVALNKEDQSKEWKEAIIKDKLEWTQISNLKHWKDPIAILYNVHSIPQTFILDATGKIVATDLLGDELRMKIKELLDEK